MKPVHSIFTLFLYASLILISGCNNNKEEKKETKAAATNIGSEQSNAEVAMLANEVKAEAPDAKTKIEQGYALPNETTNGAQSPINIISSKTSSEKQEQLTFSFQTYIEAAENLGHTIQVDFKPGSSCLVNGNQYSTRQFHFHTPSEHLIDGMTFPMEMHIVSVLNDSNNASPSYVVVGILFKMGAENKFMKEFLNKIPHEEGGKTELKTGEANLQDLLMLIPKDQQHSYYTYHGSLTTPPYTETVHWVIVKSVVEASEDQIMAIEKLEGNNARHVQALHDRKVYSQE